MRLASKTNGGRRQDIFKARRRTQMPAFKHTRAKMGKQIRAKRPSPEQEALHFIASGKDKDIFQKKFISQDKGYGIIATQDIGQGEFLLEYAGRHMTGEEGETLYKKHFSVDPTLLYFYSFEGNTFCVDCSAETTRLGRFINADHINPNCKIKIILDECKRPHLCAFALKEIPAGEEIVFDYGDPNSPWQKESRWRSLIESLESEPGVVKMDSLVFNPKRNIGEGCKTSQVFVGLFQNPVAVKRIPIHLAAHEIKMANHLGCDKVKAEHLLQPLAVQEDEHYAYLVHPLCEYNLKELIENKNFAERRHLSEERRLQICKEILLGIQELHTNGILHRDLKPENILFDGNNRLIIGDFGASKEMDVAHTALLSSLQGSLGWMSFETCEGLEYTKESDIQVAGCLIHYILTDGEHPFQEVRPYNKHLFKLSLNIVSGKFTLQLEERWSSLKAIITRMLSKELKERPTIEECLKAVTCLTHQSDTTGTKNSARNGDQNKDGAFIKKEEMDCTELSCNLPETASNVFPSTSPTEHEATECKMESTEIPVALSLLTSDELDTLPNRPEAASAECEMAETSTECSDSEDEFSEPDPDSSDDWLPSGSTGASRDSSPDDKRRNDEDQVPRRAHITTTLGTAKIRGRASSRSPGQDVEWHEAGWQPNNIPFTATAGPRDAAAELDCDIPAKFLELFLTDELLQHIADQTNLYASQYFEAHPDISLYSRGNAWKPVSISELKTFFGLTFLTGLVKKPNIELYWSVDEVDATPYFSQAMPRNRFRIIWKFLHYNDSANVDVMDKIYKVRPVLDHIVERFKKMYQPGKNICIDKGLMLCRGRPCFRAYNPQKPVKHGIKSYILCDSATGYCFNMIPYFGEESSLADTVFPLLDRLSGHGYTVYMKNSYNSVALCERLLGAQTNVCGTLRKNSGEPPVIRNLVKTKLGTGEKVVRHNEKVMVVAWQDKKLVKMVTTCHQDGMQKVDVRQRGQNDKVAQFKPECVVAFESNMNGVEKLDQNISHYPFTHRSLNWSKRFVAYLFQMCMFNAYILYQARYPRQCKTLLEFIRRVVKSWTLKGHLWGGSDVVAWGEEGADVEDGLCKVIQHTPRAPYNTDPESRLDGDFLRHKLCRLTPTNRKQKPARRCRVCIRRGTRSETKMMCRACGVPLHPGQCYIDYHSKENYCLKG